jgi:hypothetical protein
MDDWSVSAEASADAIGEAPNSPQSVTLTQARLFMDDIRRSGRHDWKPSGAASV